YCCDGFFFPGSCPIQFEIISSSVAETHTQTNAIITWATTMASVNNIIEYGTDPGYGSLASTIDGGTLHGLQLLGLTPGTTYYFKITSCDAADTQNCAEYSSSFITTQATPSPTPSTIPSPSIPACTPGDSCSSDTYCCDYTGSTPFATCNRWVWNSDCSECVQLENPTSCGTTACPAGYTGTPCNNQCNIGTNNCGTCTPTCTPIPSPTPSPSSPPNPCSFCSPKQCCYDPDHGTPDSCSRPKCILRVGNEEMCQYTCDRT
ncbi:MAG: fibronectin type III domain-containing protein, partial [Candidatus Micrarchaeota archaeon]